MANEPMPRQELVAQDWEWSKEKDPPFHRKSYSDALTEFSSHLFDEGKTQRVFIPLCGKTLDMIHLADLGHEVVGLEYSEIGIESFFKENRLTFTKEELKNAPFVVYKGQQKNITIYRGDFFDLKQAIFGQFDAFWDRGAFVAINMTQRIQYTDSMLALMKPGSRYLLEAVMYDASRYQGPPHYTTEEALKETFGRKCSIKKLGETKWAEDSIPPTAPRDLEIWDVRYFITPK